MIRRFDPAWQYGAWLDADFVMTRHDWAGDDPSAAIRRWVQMFSTYSDLSHDHRPIQTLPGFVYALEHGLDTRARPIGVRPARKPGRAWAFRREAFDQVGGLLDSCILGSGDWHMAAGLAQLPVSHPDTSQCGEAYRRHIRVWQERAKVANRDIGYVDCHAVHHFHGHKNKRGYNWRWQILRDHGFDPETDIYRDWQGLWQLTPGKPGLRDDIRRYFRSRNEDAIGVL